MAQPVAGQAVPLVVPSDQGAVLRLCNKIMGAGKSFRQVEGLLADPHGERRVLTFRGEMLISVLQEKKFKMGDLTADSPETAKEIATRLLNYVAVSKGQAGLYQHSIFAQCEAIEEEQGDDSKDDDAEEDGGGSKAPRKPKHVKRGGMFVFRPAEGRRLLKGPRLFDAKARYSWVYKGDQSWNTLRLALVAVLVLALCMYQLWPTSARVVVWYIAVTLLLAILGVTAVQLTVFAVVWVFGYDLWLLPNLWSDEPVWELLKPLVSFNKSGQGQGWYRMALVGLLLALGYYVYKAGPGEMDLFLEQQRELVKDLYAGTLITGGEEGAGSGRGALPKDKWAGVYGKRRGGPAIPDIEEFDKMFEDPKPAAAAEEAASPSSAPASSAEQQEEEAAAAAAAAAEADAPDIDSLLDSHEDEDDEVGEGEKEE